MKHIKEEIKRDAISLMQSEMYQNELTKEERKEFISGVVFALNHYKFDIDEIWDSLSDFKQEDLAERYYVEHESEDAESYDNIYEAWNDMEGDEQLMFICDKLKEFNTWEIQRVLRDNEWIKELYNETI